MTMNALDHVSAHLKLKDDGGRKGHPGGVQFRERDRLITALSQLIQQPLLLDIKDIHRSDCRAATSLRGRRPPLLSVLLGSSSRLRPRCRAVQGCLRRQPSEGAGRARTVARSTVNL
jgi:hypothetical protein